MMRQIDRDVDPDVIAAMRASRQRYAEKTAAWGNPMRCKTNVCDQDGSCVYCNADQGEACRPVADAALRPGVSA